MIETNLNDPGNEHDGTTVLLCTARKGDVLVHTCVRGDNTIPVGSYGTTGGPLFNLDIYDGCSAWRFKTAPVLGEYTNEQRLRLLLGETITVNGWEVKPR